MYLCALCGSKNFSNTPKFQESNIGEGFLKEEFDLQINGQMTMND
jgi:hypothetical protein